MCPVCAVGVAVGVGLSRWLGVDDSISGIWIGALLLILAILSVKPFFKNRDKKPFWVYILSIVIWWLLAFLPLYFIGFLSDCGKIWGIPRLVFSSLVGLIVVLLAVGLDKFLRTKKDGKAHFPYQKVIIPIAFLIIASLVAWGLC